MLLSDVEPVRAVLDRPHGLLEGPPPARGAARLLEGPRLTADGEAVYSDVIAGGVWGCSSDGVVREILPKRRGIGGILAHADGGWVISGRSVIHVLQTASSARSSRARASAATTTSAPPPRASSWQVCCATGRCQARTRGPGSCCSSAKMTHVEVLSEDVVWPNGIGVSPDGETIYLSDYAQRAVLAVARQGGKTRTFCRSPRGSADGLAVDWEGCVWVALGEGGGVARFHPDGELDEVTTLPASFVSSLSFGGSDMRDVLVTTADNLVQPELGGTLLRGRSEVAGMSMTPVSV